MPYSSLFRAVFIFLAAALLAACGQTVKQTVAPVDNTSVQPGQKACVVMLPLADYTEGLRPDESLRRQIKIHTAIAHELARSGYYMPVEEDVFRFLVDKGIITIVQEGNSVSRRNQAFRRELGSGWSPQMLKTIERELDANDSLALDGNANTIEIKQVGLDRQTIQEIGRTFSSRYLLRGRIVEYEIREGHSFNPIRKGILPFFLDSSSATLFGVAKSESYDLWQDMAIGAALGSGVALMSNPADEEGDKALAWGGVGTALAYLGHGGGKIPSGVVQVWLALQDAQTGKVVWANRVEERVEPKSAFADPKERTQIDRAVEEAAKALARDLAMTLARLDNCQNAVAQAEPVVQQVQDDRIMVEDQDVELMEEKAAPPELSGS